MTFKTADILIPKTNDNKAWSVVACDQYTSEPEYWNEVEKLTSGKASAYHLVLPEIYLEEDNVEQRIKKINDAMNEYRDNGVFLEFKDSYLYIERIQRNGKVRRGIIGMVDLEDYEYTKGSKSAIRATEGTVVERIPPRLKVRIDACLELPHVMLLIDDCRKKIIETLNEKKSSFQKVYDYDLMMDSGHITGWLVNEEYTSFINEELEKLSDIDEFNKKYSVNETNPLVFAVGDGNHSLATAKEYYNTVKANNEIGDVTLARYALVELVNLHDESLVFEAIHRVIFDVDVDKFYNELSLLCTEGKKDGQSFVFVSSDGEKTLSFKEPTANLTVGSIQNFIDKYIAENGGRVDYIHGDDVVRSLSSTNTSCGILLDSMDKNDLFKTVILDGALPRKTFSMGDACDKRFYTEARIINNTK